MGGKKKLDIKEKIYYNYSTEGRSLKSNEVLTSELRSLNFMPLSALITQGLFSRGVK